MKDATKIIDEVCKLWGVTKEELVSKKRTLHLTLVRCMAIKHIRDSCGLSFPIIGKMFNRNHSTMMHYIKMYEAEYTYNINFRNKANKIKKYTLDIRSEFEKELEQEYIEIAWQ